MGINFTPQSPSALPRGFKVDSDKRARGRASGLSKKILLVSVFCFLLAGLVYLGFFIWQRSLNSQQARIDARIQELNNQQIINPDLQEDMIATNEAVNNLKSLLRNHVICSVLLKLVEEYTSVQVQWLSLGFSAPRLLSAGVASGGLAELTLEGVTQTYLLVGRQLRIFEQMPEVNSVELSGMSPTESGINFSLDVELNPRVFFIEAD